MQPYNDTISFALSELKVIVASAVAEGVTLILALPVP
jgi:hypothetical protein